MILTDKEIIKLCKKQSLIEPFNEKQLTPNGYDLSIEKVQIDGSTANSLNDGTVAIKPNSHFLVCTKETVNIPKNLIGNMWTRSSYARQGIVSCYGVVDAGYRGKLTLSFYNSSANFINIKLNETITQLVFIKTTRSVLKEYAKRSGNYQNSKDIRVTSGEKTRM